MAERKKLTPIVSSPAVKEKKSITKRFSELFFSEGVPDFKRYFIVDLLIPTIFQGLDNLITNSSHMIFKRGSKRIGTGSPQISFGRPSYLSSGSGVNKPANTASAEADTYLLDSYQECEDVLQNLNELIEASGKASVIDYYDLIGINTSNYQLENFGWTSNIPQDIRPSGDKWYIQLPKAKPLPRN